MISEFVNIGCRYLVALEIRGTKILSQSLCASVKTLWLSVK